MSFLCQQHSSERVDLDGTEVLEVCAPFLWAQKILCQTLKQGIEAEWELLLWDLHPTHGPSEPRHTQTQKNLLSVFANSCRQELTSSEQISVVNFPEAPLKEENFPQDT